MSFNERIREIKRANYYTAPVNEPKFDNPYLLKSDTEALNDILVALKDQTPAAQELGSQALTQGGLVTQTGDVSKGEDLDPTPETQVGEPEDLNPTSILQSWMTGQSEEPGQTFIPTAEEGGDGIDGFGGGTGLNPTGVPGENLPNAGGGNSVPNYPVRPPHSSKDPTSVADFPSGHGRNLMEASPVFQKAVSTPVGSSFSTPDYKITRSKTDAFELWSHPGKDLLARDQTGRSTGLKGGLPIDKDIQFDHKNRFNEPLTGLVNANGGQNLSFYYGHPPTLGYDVSFPSGGRSDYGMTNVDGRSNARHA